VRAYEHPLLAFDRDDWAYVIPSASDADGHLEPVDVEGDEYQVYMLDGRVVEVLVIDGRVALRESEKRDLAGLHERLRALVRRYELASDPDDPVAVANELLRRDWEAGPVVSWLRRLGRRRHDGPDMVQPPAADTRLIGLLRERDGRPTAVELHDGRCLTVINIAWGYDMGDTHAHVTTNCSPFIDGEPVEVFFTDEVQRVIDQDREPPLWP
jgi:hypothetical protein